MDLGVIWYTHETVKYFLCNPPMQDNSFNYNLNKIELFMYLMSPMQSSTRQGSC